MSNSRSTIGWVVTLLSVVLIAGATSAVPVQVGDSTIEVLVSDSNDTPIARVELTLEREAASDTESTTSRTATTNTGGRAVFSGLIPGQYEVIATRNGYFGAAFFARDRISRVRVKLRESTASTARLRLIAEAVVSGRVSDANRRPVALARVRLLRINYQNGEKYLQTVRQVTTDDRGQYRFYELTAGDYYISATDHDGGSSSGPQLRRTVTLKAGQVVSDMDVEIFRPKEDRTISGTVVSRAEQPISMLLVPVGDVLEQPIYLPSLRGSSGDDAVPFEIRHISSGVYDLYVSFIERSQPAQTTDDYKYIPPRNYSARARVDLRDRDVSDIRLVIGNGATLHGQLSSHGEYAFPHDLIRTWGGSDGIGFQMLGPNLAGSDGPQGFLFAEMQDGDQFTIPNLLPGTYSLPRITSTRSVQKDDYLEDLRQDGRSVLHDGFVTIDGPETYVEVVVNHFGGRIRGALETPAPPFTTPVAVLVPDASRRAIKALYQLTFVDEGGSFSFGGVAPGPYKIMVFDISEFDELRGGFQNPGLLAPYESQGVTVNAAGGIEVQAGKARLIRRIQQ